MKYIEYEVVFKFAKEENETNDQALSRLKNCIDSLGIEWDSYDTPEEIEK